SGTARWINFNYGPLPATFPSGSSGSSVQWSFCATLNTAPTPTPTTSAPSAALQSNVQGDPQDAATPMPTPTSITIGDTTIESTNDSGNGNLLVVQKATLSQAATI